MLIGPALFGLVRAKSSVECAEDVTTAIADVVDSANNIMQAAIDCTLPGLDELVCATDITSLLLDLFDFSQSISSMTSTCGDLDNSCAAFISTSLEYFAYVAVMIMAATSDCQSDPFICTLDVVMAVDMMNEAINSILAAMKLCNARAIQPEDGDFMDFRYPGDLSTVVHNIIQGDATLMSLPLRRLQGTAAPVPDARGEDFAAVHAKALATVQGLLAQLQERRASGAPWVSPPRPAIAANRVGTVHI